MTKFFPDFLLPDQYFSPIFSHLTKNLSRFFCNYYYHYYYCYYYYHFLFIRKVFFWKFYSRGKLTCTKTCFVISTKECICNTQFYGLVTPTVHSSALSLKNPKLREQLFSGKKCIPTHESPFNIKNWSGKSNGFEKLVGLKWLNFSPTKTFSDFFFPDKISPNLLKS